VGELNIIISSICISEQDLTNETPQHSPMRETHNQSQNALWYSVCPNINRKNTVRQCFTCQYHTSDM